jgi:hypothetical protein
MTPHGGSSEMDRLKSTADDATEDPEKKAE